jgi:hypothetical protein
MNVTPPSPIPVNQNSCAICISNGSDDEENGFSELLRLECEKNDSNQNCEGTYIHHNCLQDWISSSGVQLRCLCCHSGNLKLERIHLSQEILIRTLFLQYLQNNRRNNDGNNRYNDINAGKIYLSFLLGAAIFLFIFTHFY